MQTRILATLVSLLLANFVPVAATTFAAEPPRPNIVFVLADDLGWSELGCYGNGFNETPHLDRLAAAGVRFTQAYAAAPVCSPYRAALLSGQHPARIGITDYLRPNSANALSTAHETLPEILQRNGYATGMIGKWHLTGYQHHGAEHEIKPRQHGFGWDFAREVKGVGNGANFWPYVFRDQPIRWIDIPENRLGEGEFLVDRMNAEAVDFIERNRDRPFFLYLSHYAPHSILNGKPDLVSKYIRKHAPGASTRQRCYLCQDQGKPGDALHHWAGDHNPHLAAMLESIDDGIGMIRAKLDETGLADNTIFIFSSDNGGEANVTSNAPLRGGKSQLYEGGVRVPLLVEWPGQTPAGEVCENPTVNVDFYPTLLEAAGVKPPANQKLDGVSTLAQWRNPQAADASRTICWHYPLDRPHFLGGASSGAIRSGDWKLIEFFQTGRTELYRLADDVSERRDLAAENPETVRRLRGQLAEWRERVGARTPSPPLLAAPRKLYFADHFSPGQVSSRWAFSKDWSVADGILQRHVTGSPNTRIFLKKPAYRDVVIRFDFRLRDARDIRLVTGGNGHYNAVVHIRRDHFYVQTALDRTGPYFSHRHGECAFSFEPDRWYSMTVEFVGDELVAHLDRDHLAYAKHPILDKERAYFAFQVDEFAAAFDNVQILTAARHGDYEPNLAHIQQASGAFPVAKTLDEEFKIQKTNAHDRLYQQEAEYRALVKVVDDLDEKNKQLFPNVFRSHKEFRKEIQALRKQLLDKDPQYKQLLFATYRAARAIEAYVVAQDPRVAELPDSRRLTEIERIRARHKGDAEYGRLVVVRDMAQERLEENYPMLFRSDKQINDLKRQHRQRLDRDPAFRQALDQRAAAWRAQQEYLLANDEKLADLQRRVDEDKKKR
ncbi:MAG: sulfatase-like hydrolase/transferase [Pirellulaceae bacterium]|jgi:arylsulfatase A-like enzyme|nr:sulfatase-like hydrolase/transferase [Pirellulaceae bacterium]MDP7014548.1 sulfatase-like hydrolase/transferase [Pirellulaceae bacterium]